MRWQIAHLKWLIISLVVVVLDQLSKMWILTFLRPAEIFPVLPFFNLSLSFNSGAAFSFLADAGGWQLVFFSAISMVAIILLSIWLVSLQKTSWSSAGALALVIGGAAGNLIDRVRVGYVTDFLDFYYQHWHFAMFNVADAAICIGAALLLLNNFLQTRSA